MTAPIIQHPPQAHPDDDPEHPIPAIAVIDVARILVGGGADLSLLVASPLQADRRSLQRLLDKLETYLRHIRDPKFLAEAGSPEPRRTTIRVIMHPDSAPEAFELLRRNSDWVRGNGATLKIELLDLNVH